MRVFGVVALALLVLGGVHASASFSPPADPLEFVQGKWPQTRTGGELEVVGNRVIVSEAARFDGFGQREVGDVVFEIESFRIEASDDQKHGFSMRVSGTKYTPGHEGRIETTHERWVAFDGLRFNGMYRYRFLGGDRDLAQPAP